MSRPTEEQLEKLAGLLKGSVMSREKDGLGVSEDWLQGVVIGLTYRTAIERDHSNGMAFLREIVDDALYWLEKVLDMVGKDKQLEEDNTVVVPNWFSEN